MNQDTKGLMYMFTILFLNQKGGVGKTTLADELAFALERRGSTVAFVSTDPQGAPSTRSAMTRTTPSPAITRLSIRRAS